MTISIQVLYMLILDLARLKSKFHTNFFFGFVVIKNSTDSVLKSYIKYKVVTVSKRFCNYGGHMIYFFKKNLNQIRYNINYFDEF